MKTIVTFGEIMGRMASPENLRLRQTRNLEVTYAGAEAWIIRTKLTPLSPVDFNVFYRFAQLFCVTFRQMLTPFEVAKWVAKSGAC